MNAPSHRIGRIALAELGSLAPFRALDDWTLCPADSDDLWLRVPLENEEIFRKLPLLGRWTSDENGDLTRDGRRVPEMTLPESGWLSLATHLSLTPPTRGTPGMPPPPITFQLEKDDADRPAEAVMCAAENFAAWAEMVIAPRLGCLRFAYCENGLAFVVGLPLPAISGAGFFAHGQLWLPCGYRLPDHVWADLVAEKLGLGRNRRSIFHADGSHEELDDENLVPATRAAIRTTLKPRQAIA